MSSLLEEHAKGMIFINRLLLFLVMVFALFLILIIRLFYLQISNYNYFKNRSENNRIKIEIIPPLRGDIVDRNNNKLTNNRNSYGLTLYRNNKQKDSEFTELIADILNFNQDKISRINRRLKNNRNKSAVLVLDNLTWDELVKIENNTYKLNNISIDDGYIREYLYSYEFAHILGYVSIPNDKDIDNLSDKIKKDILLHPNFKIGKNGLEASYNSKLTGKSGYKKTEINAFNVPIRELDKKEAEKGIDIRLTLDLKLQSYIYNKVKDMRASIIVLNVKTGEILSMVSTPSFDTNEFINGISNDYWNNLINDEKKPMFNKTISALYAMGSTFKPVVSIAALENGWNKDKKIDCKGTMNITKKQIFKCWTWREHGHGKINIIEALERSCNIFFANIGLSAGVNNIYDTAKKLGIGENFNLGLKEYNAGILPNQSWKLKTYKESWTSGDTINMSIGQGYILANPLQMAVMVSRIANNGYPIIPFLIYNSPLREHNKNLFNQDPMFNEESIKITKQGMFNVINAKHGTAYWTRPKGKEEKYGICGKTGTAQVISLTLKEKLENELDKNQKLKEKYVDHGLFVGFAPFDDPLYGISVIIEHGSGGSVSAAPVAVDILKYAIDNKII